MANKKDKILEQHPEVRESAKDYFNFETNPIIEEVVNRGDAREVNPNPSDITGEDVKDLAKYAVELINKKTLEGDKKRALEEAVALSIGSKDNGKWQNKINTNTYDLILNETEKLFTAAKEKKVMSTQSLNDKEMNMSYGSKEAGEKESADFVDIKGKKVSPGNKHKILKGMPGTQRALMRRHKGPVTIVEPTKAVKKVEKAAQALEDLGNTKLAEQLDKVANTLDLIIKEAAGKYLRDSYPLVFNTVCQPSFKINDLSGQDFQDFSNALESMSKDLEHPSKGKALKFFLNNQEVNDLKDAIGRLRFHGGDRTNAFNRLKRVLEDIKDAPLETE